jgi:hypothetical protein
VLSSLAVWGNLSTTPYDDDNDDDDSRISVHSQSTPHFIISNRDVYQLT